ncbi:conserved hypothetical protein [Ricinus communis]|uniref:Uncharacterized protein n=1 Tax=Ricinus communis TaxID=3988 RepID=B9RD66_RICCO|nr:conserved hypothetical protein [Ricinus communis]
MKEASNVGDGYPVGKTSRSKRKPTEIGSTECRPCHYSSHSERASDKAKQQKHIPGCSNAHSILKQKVI